MSLEARHFSLDEAQSLLKELLPYLSRLIELKGILDVRHFDIYRHQFFGGMGPNGDGKFPPEVEEVVNILKRFAAQGVLVKSLDDGLIDFPYVRENGEEVYLCYKLGEDSILYWHSPESGFAGRRSISQL